MDSSAALSAESLAERKALQEQLANTLDLQVPADTCSIWQPMYGMKHSALGTSTCFVLLDGSVVHHFHQPSWMG